MKYETPFTLPCAHPERNGQTCAIVRTITRADATHDQEVLPMHVIRFTDGFQMEAFAEEVIQETAEKAAP